MTERLDVLTGRKDEKSGKTYWTRIGVAFASNDGAGWNVQLDALPVSGQMILRPPKPREDKPIADRGRATAPDLDDSVPF
jgi:hypothetical protein